jgi:hypothetical protein
VQMKYIPFLILWAFLVRLRRTKNALASLRVAADRPASFFNNTFRIFKSEFMILKFYSNHKYIYLFARIKKFFLKSV